MATLTRFWVIVPRDLRAVFADGVRATSPDFAERIEQGRTIPVVSSRAARAFANMFRIAAASAVDAKMRAARLRQVEILEELAVIYAGRGC